jgi:hypothetical protein
MPNTRAVALTLALIVPEGLVAAPALPATVTPKAGDVAAAFGALKGLVGEWSGAVLWTGARTGTGSLDVRYHLTGNGSAVVEDLVSDGVIAMTSVYHMDGHDLRLTHFCGAGNQPRLEASRIGPEARTLHFAFVDITNLKTPETGHVTAVDLRIVSAGKAVLTFTFLAAGKESYERIDLTRAPARQ